MKIISRPKASKISQAELYLALAAVIVLVVAILSGKIDIYTAALILVVMAGVLVLRYWLTRKK